MVLKSRFSFNTEKTLKNQNGLKMEWVPRAGSKFLVGGGGAGSKCGCLIKVGNLNPPVTLESSGELLFKAPVLTLFPQRVLFNWFDWDQPSDLKLKASQVIPARPQG